MILYDKDFEIEGTMVHYQTKNQSAIKMSILLGKMGIKNNKFHLALLQPELADIDPHDPNLPEVIKYKIAIECKLNIWYFIREVVRVPFQGKEASPYIFNRANLALTWLFCNNITPFLTMPRQIGKTIATITIMTWILYFAGDHLATALFAKDNNLILENVERLKVIRDGLPKYLINSSPKDTDNKEGIGYHHLHTKYMTYTAQPSKLKAMGQGRGPSISLEHWDEFAYYLNNDLSYPSATSAITAAQEQARESGMPCTNIITTTAGRLSEPNGLYAYKIKNNCMRFTEKLYDSGNNDKLTAIINDNSTNGMCYLEYSYKQLGKSEKWFQKAIVDKDPDTIACDYLNIWQHIARNSVISKDIADKLERHQIEPITCTTHKTLMLRWYVNPNLLKTAKYRNRPFVIGIDTSDNVGRDFTTFVMIDPTDMSVVCTCKCNITNFVYVASCIADLMIQYPKSIIIPERNKNGANLIDVIALALESNNINPMKRIYNLFYQNHDRTKVLPTKVNIMGANKSNFGFWTGTNSRHDLYSTVLTQTVQNNYDKIYDSDIISEIKGLTLRNNRIDHSKGGHDDLLVAYLLGCYFILYGKNIHLYDVDRNLFLSEVSYKGEKVDPLEKQRQLELISKIKVLEDKIEKTQSEILRKSFDLELRALKDIVDHDIIDTSTMSIDKAISKNEEETKPFNFFDGKAHSISLFEKLIA